MFTSFQTLRKVELMKSIGEAKLTKLAEVLDEETYKKGEYIVRQGTYGETFFIILEGEVGVTENKGEKQSGGFIRTIGKGSYFGEQALRNESGKRGANVIARSSIVRCMTLEKKHFLRLIGDKADTNWDKTPRSSGGSSHLQLTKLSTAGSRQSSTVSMPVRTMQSVYKAMTLSDLEFVGILGVGGFGRVELRRHKENQDQSYALKCLKKVKIATVLSKTPGFAMNVKDTVWNFSPKIKN